MSKLTLALSTLAILFISSLTHANPKLYVFDCGSISMADVSAFGLSNQETDVRKLFVPCYLIENNGKRLLWDGGLPLGLAGNGSQREDSGMVMEYQNSLLNQLTDLQLEPENIDFVAFSHFHFDHVGAANAFVDSTMLIHQDEFQAAFVDADKNPIFDPSLYMDLKNANKVLLDADYDVFGDGSVIIIPAPGHTPGHQVLLVNLENTGPIMLSGDLYHFEFSRRMRRVPDFNTDKAQTLKSMATVEARLKESGATLWIEHNQALADTLKKAPAYYD